MGSITLSMDTYKGNVAKFLVALADVADSPCFRESLITASLWMVSRLFCGSSS
jgi:hypothetical protein